MQRPMNRSDRPAPRPPRVRPAMVQQQGGDRVLFPLWSPIPARGEPIPQGPSAWPRASRASSVLPSWRCDSGYPGVGVGQGGDRRGPSVSLRAARDRSCRRSRWPTSGAGAQPLELLLLEQEVLADAGVERLDRVHRQLVPLLDAGWRRGGRRWPWPRGPGSRSARRSWPPAPGWPGACTAIVAAAPPTSGQQHRRRQRRDRRPPPAPEPGPLGRPRPAAPRSAGRRARRAGRRPGPGPWRSAAAGPSPGTSGRSTSRSRGTCGVEPARRLGRAAP